MMVYPWYDIVKEDNSLEQGDFLENCPIIIPPIEYLTSEEVNVDVKEYDVVIMSQSCDLQQEKIDLVLVCPAWNFSEFEKTSDFFKSTSGKKALKDGNVPGYHLLNKCDLEGYKAECRVVDFRNVYSIHLNCLKDIIAKKDKRLRLLSPYREHLSQAFARFFMRVGLPTPISFGQV